MSIIDQDRHSSLRRQTYRAFGLELTLPRLRRLAGTRTLGEARDQAMVAAARVAFAPLDISFERGCLRYAPGAAAGAFYDEPRRP